MRGSASGEGRVVRYPIFLVLLQVCRGDSIPDLVGANIDAGVSGWAHCILSCIACIRANVAGSGTSGNPSWAAVDAGVSGTAHRIFACCGSGSRGSLRGFAGSLAVVILLDVSREAPIAHLLAGVV